MIQDGRGVVVKLDMGDGTYLLQYHFSSASPSVYGLEGKYYTDAMPLGLQLIVSGGVAIVLGFLLGCCETLSKVCTSLSHFP